MKMENVWTVGTGFIRILRKASSLRGINLQITIKHFFYCPYLPSLFLFIKPFYSTVSVAPSCKVINTNTTFKELQNKQTQGITKVS